MKKVLIIQQDDAYFLFETFQVLERHYLPLKEVELHILVDSSAYKEIFSKSLSLFENIHFEFADIKDISFDESFNLSNNEFSWDVHNQVSSQNKTGPYQKNGSLTVHDLWSIHLLTLKSKAPFLTIHLQDIYRNILKLPHSIFIKSNSTKIERIIYTPSSISIFTANEQENFIYDLSKLFPNIPIIDLTEINDSEDLTSTLYIGPLSLEACRICADGCRGIFLVSNFQGFNLFPYSRDNILISSRGHKFDSKNIIDVLENSLHGNDKNIKSYAIYTAEKDVSTSLFLKSNDKDDIAYPIYKSHFVLWNFILSLEDIDLPLSLITLPQKEVISENLNVLTKMLYLQDFALNSVNAILKQAKLKLVDTKKLDENMNIVREYDDSALKIAESYPYLRPFLDFFRIRKGQSEAFSLLEQAEDSLLLYSEEQQVLSALSELFSVTLNKFEAKI